MLNLCIGRDVPVVAYVHCACFQLSLSLMLTGVLPMHRAQGHNTHILGM